MVHFWISIGWRWALRIFIILIMGFSSLMQYYFNIRLIDYLWNNYLMFLFIGFFFLTFIGKKRKELSGGE